MGLLRKSEETATRTDPLASWGERAWKAVLWIFGPSTLLGAAVTAWGWLTHNPQYGFLIGLITFTVFQAGLTFNAIRKSRARKGPMAQLGYPSSSGEVAGDGGAPSTGNSELAQETDAASEQSRVELRLTKAEKENLEGQLRKAEQERDSFKALSQGQLEQLSDWDGDRQRFKGFLLEAWSEGTNLRGSKPSQEEAREWESHVRHLLEQAVGKEIADKVLRHDPHFQSGDFDATDAQKFLEMRLHEVDRLRKNVARNSAIPFRSGFDPYEWNDWKSPPPTSSADFDSHLIPEHMIAERHIRYHEAPIPLVDLLEAVGDNGVLRDFQFEHCTLEGPGIINLEGPFPKPETTTSDSDSFGRASISVGPTHCRVEGSPDTTLYRVTHDSKPPVGTIHLSGYTLQSVTFKGLGFAGTPEHIERLKEQLIFSEGNNSPIPNLADEVGRQRIEDWRSVIRDFDFGAERFAETDTYSQMKQYLRPEVIEMLEAQRTVHIGNEARGDTAYRYTLLDEVARIEKEWGLI